MKLQHGLLVFGLLCSLPLLDGCGVNSTARPKTEAQVFQEQQEATMTPNGKIKKGTVTGTSGKFQYETEDGKKWEVTPTKRADGTSEYSTPAEIKK